MSRYGIFIRTVACALAIAPLACFAAVEARFDLAGPDTAPFPSNRFSDFDLRNLTSLRLTLPKPDCTVRVTDCSDIDVINTLDGFNLQPRLRIPFSGAIDPASVNSSNVFLVRLGDTTRPDWQAHGLVGINQIVWDPATTTLFAESDEFLEEHTTYALIVTDGVRDASGQRVRGAAFHLYLRSPIFGRGADFSELAYRASLYAAIAAADVPSHRIVAASVFTTQSASAVLEKIRRQIKRNTPQPASFVLGDNDTRTVFPLASVASISFTRQTGTTTVQISPVPTIALSIVPGAVGTIAFGRFSSPDYLTEQRYIPPVHTRTGVPAVQRRNDVYVDLYLPAGPKPTNGWPVAIFGHGFGDQKNSTPLTVAAVFAAHGIATAAINVVGHGGGPNGTLTVNRGSLPAITLPSGGRGIDQNGNGTIDATEGASAAAPFSIVSNRDGLRQTVVDLMQLVRVIETGGMDVDSDGLNDLDANRIYYTGQSFGGIYGTMLLGVEPSIRVGVPNVAGGTNIDLARLGSFRPSVGQGLGARVPSLLNALPFVAPAWGFNENMPLRNQPTVTNSIAGAIELQNFFDNSEWVSQSGNPVAYAPLLRKSPLRGVDAKSVILQFAKGDVTVPNPTNIAIVRAGELADRTTFYRHDLAYAANPALTKNPHGFLTSIGQPLMAPVAIAAQTQIATFFASDGATTLDPDGAAPLFETPIAQPLTEALNFIP